MPAKPTSKCSHEQFFDCWGSPANEVFVRKKRRSA